MTDTNYMTTTQTAVAKNLPCLQDGCLECSTSMGHRIDGSVTMFWGSRKRAVDGAKAIGWPVKSITPIWTRFQRGYALTYTHGNLLTKAAYGALHADRNGVAA